MEIKKIDEYDVVVYPRKIWVAQNLPIKEIAERFSYQDGQLISEDDFEGFEAACLAVCDKKNEYKGELIVFVSSTATETIAHEACHAAMDIAHGLDIKPDTDNQEPIAYLVGYIAKCCSKSLKQNEQGNL